jgi:hypothetical protein
MEMHNELLQALWWLSAEVDHAHLGGNVELARRHEHSALLMLAALEMW